MPAVAPIQDSLGLKGMGREAWASRFFQTIDAMDAAGFAAFFTPGGSFRMANNPAHVGRAAIEEFVRGFFAALAGLSHDTIGLWESSDTLVCEGMATYRTPNDQTMGIGYLGVIEFEGELIREYRLYMDPAPLVAALQG